MREVRVCAARLRRKRDDVSHGECKGAFIRAQRQLAHLSLREMAA